MQFSKITDEYGTWCALSKEHSDTANATIEIKEQHPGGFDLYYDLAHAVLSNDRFMIIGGSYTEVKESRRVFEIEGYLSDVYYRFAIHLSWDYYKLRYRYGHLDLYCKGGGSLIHYDVQHYPYYPQGANLSVCSNRIIEYLKEYVIKPENKLDTPEE